MLKGFLVLLLMTYSCRGMEKGPGNTVVPSLKILATQELFKKLTTMPGHERTGLLEQIPTDLEQLFCNPLKEYKLEELKKKATRIVCEHGKKSVLNYTNTIFAGVSTAHKDKVLLSAPDSESDIACNAARGLPIEMLAWHPTKDIIAVAQKGLWFFALNGTTLKHCECPLKNREAVKKMAWDDDGHKFVFAGKKQLGMFCQDFLEHSDVPTKYLTFPDQFPHHHYDSLQEVQWNPSGTHILAWQKSGGTRGYVGQPSSNYLFVIDSSQWQIIRQITFDRTAEFQGALDDSSVLVSQWGQLRRFHYDTEPAWIEHEYSQQFSSYYAIWRALHINARYILIERKNAHDERVLIMYDRESKKSFTIPASFKGLVQLSIDKKLVYGNDYQDDIIDIRYLTEQCTFKELLMHLEQSN